MAPLDREYDNEAVQLEDEDDDNDANDNPATFLSAIAKVTKYHAHHRDVILRALLAQLRKIIRNVRSSPQRRQKWCKEIYIAMNQGGGEDQSPALILILDVRTQWSSTHQMLRETQTYSIAVSSIPYL